EDRKSTDRSRRSVLHRGPDGFNDEWRRLLPVATAIPKYGCCYSWFNALGSAVRRDMRGALLALPTYAASSIRALLGTTGMVRPRRHGKRRSRVDCGVLSPCDSAILFHPLLYRSSRQSRTACQLLATLGERSMTRNAEDGRFRKA
ncbi:hypothetical protein MRX96_052634, partial [Rhipicephalus microplus]